MKKWFTPLVIALFALVLALIDAGLVPAAGNPFRLVSFVFTASLFSLIVIRDDFAFLLFCLGTAITWLTASSTLIIPLAIGCLVLLGVNESVDRLFTNRTYYSVIAVATVGWAAYQAGITISFAFAAVFGSNSVPLPTAAELAVGWVILAASTTLAYMATVLFSKKIRSYFIVGSNSV